MKRSPIISTYESRKRRKIASVPLPEPISTSSDSDEEYNYEDDKMQMVRKIPKRTATDSLFNKLAKGKRPKQTKLTKIWNGSDRTKHRVVPSSSIKMSPSIASSTKNIAKPELQRLIRVVLSEGKDAFHFFVPVGQIVMRDEVKKAMRLERRHAEALEPQNHAGEASSTTTTSTTTTGTDPIPSPQFPSPEDLSQWSLAKLNLPPPHTCPSFNNDQFIQFTLHIEEELIGFVKTLERLIHLESIYFVKSHREIVVLSEQNKNVWKRKDLSITINGNIVFVVDYDNEMYQESTKYTQKNNSTSTVSAVQCLEESLRRYPSNKDALASLVRSYFNLSSYEKAVDRCDEYLSAGHDDPKSTIIVYKVASLLLLGCKQYNLAEAAAKGSLTKESDLKKCRSVTNAEKDAERQESDIQYFEDRFARDYLARAIVLLKRATQAIASKEGIEWSAAQKFVRSLARFAVLFLMYHGRAASLCPKCLKPTAQDDMQDTELLGPKALRDGVEPDDKFMAKYSELKDAFMSLYERAQARERVAPPVLKCCKTCAKLRCASQRVSDSLRSL